MIKENQRIRVAAFIDGFNVYHLLDKPNLRKYKWLNYSSLAARFLPRGGELVSVQYFTAKATWDERKARRHDLYMRALRHFGVECVVGRFKKLKKKVVIYNEASWKSYTTVDGKITGSLFYGYTFEEKKTDVNIASEMITKAATNACDYLLLVSGDTDFEPAIKIVQEVFKKSIIVAVPNKRISGSIKAIVPKGNCVSIREKDFAGSLLPSSIKLSNGLTIECPQEWR